MSLALSSPRLVLCLLSIAYFQSPQLVNFPFPKPTCVGTRNMNQLNV